MKKFAVITLLFVSCFSLFAVSVCVYPADSELEKLIATVYPNTKVKHLNMTISTDTLLEHDVRFMEFMGKKSESTVLLFPLKDTMADFSHYSIYSYDISSGNFRKVYEKLYQGNLDYNKDMIESLSYLFMEINPNRVYDKNNVNNLKINLDSMKKTVLSTEAYTHNSDAYTAARNKFYKSFARTLGVFGLRVLFSSLNYNSLSFKQLMDIGTKAGIGVSSWYLYKDLKNYVNSVEY